MLQLHHAVRFVTKVLWWVDVCLSVCLPVRLSRQVSADTDGTARHCLTPSQLSRSLHRAGRRVWSTVDDRRRLLTTHGHVRRRRKVLSTTDRPLGDGGRTVAKFSKCLVWDKLSEEVLSFCRYPNFSKIKCSLSRERPVLYIQKNKLDLCSRFR